MWWFIHVISTRVKKAKIWNFGEREIIFNNYYYFNKWKGKKMADLNFGSAGQ